MTQLLYDMLFHTIVDKTQVISILTLVSRKEFFHLEKNAAFQNCKNFPKIQVSDLNLHHLYR